MESIIENKIKRITADKLGVDEAIITPESKFSELGADSLDGVELLMEFEKEFNITIPDKEMEAMKTIGEVILYIEKNKK